MRASEFLQRLNIQDDYKLGLKLLTKAAKKHKTNTKTESNNYYLSSDQGTNPQKPLQVHVFTKYTKRITPKIPTKWKPITLSIESQNSKNKTPATALGSPATPDQTKKNTRRKRKKIYTDASDSCASHAVSTNPP